MPLSISDKKEIANRTHRLISNNILQEHELIYIFQILTSGQIKYTKTDSNYLFNLAKYPDDALNNVSSFLNCCEESYNNISHYEDTENIENIENIENNTEVVKDVITIPTNVEHIDEKEEEVVYKDFSEELKILEKYDDEMMNRKPINIDFLKNKKTTKKNTKKKNNVKTKPRYEEPEESEESESEESEKSESEKSESEKSEESEFESSESPESESESESESEFEPKLSSEAESEVESDSDSDSESDDDLASLNDKFNKLQASFYKK